MTERVLTQRQKVEQRLAEITDHEFKEFIDRWKGREVDFGKVADPHWREVEVRGLMANYDSDDRARRRIHEFLRIPTEEQLKLRADQAAAQATADAARAARLSAEAAREMAGASKDNAAAAASSAQAATAVKWGTIVLAVGTVILAAATVLDVGVHLGGCAGAAVTGVPAATQPATPSVEPMWMKRGFQVGTLLVLAATACFVAMQVRSMQKTALAEALLQAMGIDTKRKNRSLRGWVMAFGRPLRKNESSREWRGPWQPLDPEELGKAKDACRHMDELAMLGKYGAIKKRRMIKLWGDVLCKTWIVLGDVIKAEQKDKGQTGRNNKTIAKWGAFDELGRRAYKKLGWPRHFQAKPERFDEERNVLSVWSRVCRRMRGARSWAAENLLGRLRGMRNRRRR